MLPDLVLGLMLSNLSFSDLLSIRLVSRQYNVASCRLLKRKIKTITFENEREIEFFNSCIPVLFDSGSSLIKFELRRLHKISLEPIKLLVKTTNACQLAELTLDLKIKTSREGFSSGRTLIYCLQNWTNVQCLHLKFNSMDIHTLLLDFEPNFPNLKRFEITFGKESPLHNTNPMAKKIINSAHNLKYFVLTITISKLTVIRRSEDDSLLHTLPELFKNIPKRVKVGLNILASPSFPESSAVHSVSMKLFTKIFNELMEIRWEAFQLHVTRELGMVAEGLVRKQAEMLQEFEIHLNGLTNIQPLSFPNCNFLELTISWGDVIAKDLYQSFQNVRHLRLLTPSQIAERRVLEALEKFATKLPNLTELELYEIKWEYLTKEPMKKLSEIMTIVNNTKPNKMDSTGSNELLICSNPLGHMTKLEFLKIDVCHDSALDWVLYISAIGGLKRLNALTLKLVQLNTPMKHCYSNILGRYHDHVQLK